jgi:PHD/YefM family antitoxin component YafN of YafNO toxin-antitoxin module
MKGADSMQIIPMRDLKNTVEVERRCAEENGPVFVTKNGYGRLVVMDIDYYEKTMRKMDEATTILDGLKDVKSGNTVEGDTAISKIRSKYGI